MARLAAKAALRARRLFEEALASGHDYREASRAAGVSERTGRRWRKHLRRPVNPIPVERPAGSRLGPAGTSFEGRAEALRDIADRFEQGARLVSVVGPPGIGKTRLALEWIASGGCRAVWGTPVFCDLRHAESKHDLTAEIVRSLGQPLLCTGEAAGLKEALATYEAVLLVLDNFEQLVPCATAVAGWLEHAPGLRVLVTSRRVLRIQSEVTLELPPLATPPEGSDADTAWRTDAVRLLWARARDAEPGLALDESTKVELGEVARLLQGVPLALELAATRLAAVTSKGLANEIRGHRLRLANPWQDCDPRHVTLESAIDRSWRLLSPAEQVVLAQLTVFRGGFTIEAAGAVVAVRGATRASVPRVVATLRESSLLRLANGPDRRWDFFEAIRDFGASRLDEAQTHRARQRHATHYLERGETWLSQLSTAQGMSARKHLATELANLQSAFEWFASRETAGSERMMRMGCVLHEALTHVVPFAAIDVATKALGSQSAGIPAIRVRISLLLRRAVSSRVVSRCDEVEVGLAEVQRLLAEFEASLGANVAQRFGAELAYHRACLARTLGQIALSRPYLEVALVGAREIGDRVLEARARMSLGRVLAEAFADLAAFDEFEKATGIFRELGDSVAEAECLSHDLTYSVFYRREIPPEKLERQLAIPREAGHRCSEAYAEFVLALRALDAGALSEARDRALRVYDLMRCSNLRLTGSCAMIVGNAFDQAEASLEQAAQWYRTASNLASRVRDGRLGAVSNAFLAAVYVRLGRVESANRLLEDAVVLLQSSGHRRSSGFVELQRGWIELAQAKAAFDASNTTEFERSLDRVRERIAIAHRRPITTSQGALSLTACCLKARIAVRLLRRELGAVSSLSRSLHVAADASWFRIGSGDVTPVAEGPLTRRLLLDLANERRHAPGRPISTADLVSRCWPGERLMGDSGPRRVRDLVRRLRQAGLHAHLETGPEGGYRLDPSVPVVIEAGDH